MTTSKSFTSHELFSGPISLAPGHNDHWFLQDLNKGLEHESRIVRRIIIAAGSNIAKEPPLHKMTNKARKQIRIAKKRINDKRIRIVSKIRAVWELKESKKTCLASIINKKMIKSARRINIAEQKANNSRKKATINKRMIKSVNKRISIAKQEANDNRKIKDQRIRIPRQVANCNRKPRTNQLAPQSKRRSTTTIRIKSQPPIETK